MKGRDKKKGGAIYFILFVNKSLFLLSARLVCFGKLSIGNCCFLQSVFTDWLHLNSCNYQVSSLCE